MFKWNSGWGRHLSLGTGCAVSRHELYSERGKYVQHAWRQLPNWVWHLQRHVPSDDRSMQLSVQLRKMSLITSGYIGYATSYLEGGDCVWHSHPGKAIAV